MIKKMKEDLGKLKPASQKGDESQPKVACTCGAAETKHEHITDPPVSKTKTTKKVISKEKEGADDAVNSEDKKRKTLETKISHLDELMGFIKEEFASV
jgi:hypothetical protein